MKSENDPKKKTILVAPLHWGLGHATRCIPIIKSLIENDYEVLIGSDGAALMLLKKEFPELGFIDLPAYDVKYSQKGIFFKWKMMLGMPKIQKAIRRENRIVSNLVAESKINGIISDNRMGVYHKNIPSVYITHQLNVLSGSTSAISSKMHQRIIRKFDQCWIPDLEGSINLSGKLGHLNDHSLNLKYIGPISRMAKRNLPSRYDKLILLSGPEPQRTLLEVKMLEVFQNTEEEILLVRGVVSDRSQNLKKGNITIVDFMQSQELEEAINQSELVISRPGYTTIMDLASLEKPAFFIPTPGQYEQKYLAKQLRDQGIVPSCKQEKFSLKKLRKVPAYRGLKTMKPGTELGELFGLFQGE
ncbi:glycosyltransferase [Aureitalea marina]|uniref:Glycosyltransferase n=1 Tax=Aureitalea marina TaxID=930804 RepID=A0A2S7KT94_9FLAO|nr:glycosyltransferase [Aureitalea marina]PQB05837.1 glycosyltransferase [Aureitalea marina]